MENRKHKGVYYNCNEKYVTGHHFREQKFFHIDVSTTPKMEEVGPEEPIDGSKNPSQQRGSLPVPQVPIILTNVWYGRPDEIMDPLPSRGLFESVNLNQEK